MLFPVSLLTIPITIIHRSLFVTLFRAAIATCLEVPAKHRAMRATLRPFKVCPDKPENVPAHLPCHRVDLVHIEMRAAASEVQSQHL